MKIAIIGGGNIGMALAEGLVRAAICAPGDILITRRSTAAFAGLEQKGFRTGLDNAAAIRGVDTIFMCVLPQQLDGALEQIQPVIDLEKQLVVSVVTGAHTQV